MSATERQTRKSLVEKTVAQAIRRWANAPEVIVFDGVDDLTDDDLRASLGISSNDANAAYKRSASKEPHGFFYRNTVFINSARMPDKKTVVETLMHESLGHYGLRGTFGGALDSVLEDVVTLRKDDIARKMQAYKLENTRRGRLIAAEEVLADIAQTVPDISLVQRATSDVRNWLRAHIDGLQNLELTREDIIAKYILPARAFVQRAGEPEDNAENMDAFTDVGSSADKVYSRKTNKTDLIINRTQRDALIANFEEAQNRAQDICLKAGIANPFTPGQTLHESLIALHNAISSLQSNTSVGNVQTDSIGMQLRSQFDEMGMAFYDLFGPDAVHTSDRQDSTEPAKEGTDLQWSAPASSEQRISNTAEAQGMNPEYLEQIDAEYSGIDLKVGGEGMNAFYDKIVPNTVNALLKKIGGGKVEGVNFGKLFKGHEEGGKVIVGKDFVVYDSESGRAVSWPETRSEAMEYAYVHGVTIEWDADYTGEHASKQPGFTITPAMREAASNGLALFARNPDGKGLEEGFIPGMTELSVSGLVRSITAKWRNAPEIVVVADMNDPRIPVQPRLDDLSQRKLGAQGTVKGFVYGGKAYIVAGNMRSDKDVALTLYHECLGHMGLRGVFGHRLEKILGRVAINFPAAIQSKARQYKLDLNTREGLLDSAEEVLAGIAQTKPSLSLLQRATSTVKNVLRNHVPGFKNLRMTRNDLIAGFILPARNFVERKSTGFNLKKLTPSFLRAFHGTPHNGIEKFSTEKIGTGEGAQAFGWGLYFASKREVADHYRVNLANRDESNQNRLNAHANAQRLAQLAGDSKYAADDVRFVLETNPDHPQSKLLTETLSLIESGDFAKPLKETGQLYEVEIPEENEMLDWHKPLSEQDNTSDAWVRSKWRDIAEEENLPYQYTKAKNFAERTGEDLYKALSSKLGGDKAASKVLYSYGIKGIKYLDRTLDGGTHNYVIFDGDDVAIERSHFRRTDDTQTDAATPESIDDLHALTDVEAELGGVQAFEAAKQQGKTSLSYGQWLQIQTPQFKEWFGNSGAVHAVNAITGQPITSSKEPKLAEPMMMYHTSRNDFTAFELGRTTINSGTFGDWETSRSAVFVTPSANDSEEYGKSEGKFVEGANVMPLYIRAENPLDLSAGVTDDVLHQFEDAGVNPRWLQHFGWSKFDDADGRIFVDAAKSLGYDAVIFNDENPATQRNFEAWAIFNPNQIKSAIGNNGQFNPDNPDIRYKLDDATHPDSDAEPVDIQTEINALRQQIEADPISEQAVESIHTLKEIIEKDAQKTLASGQAAVYVHAGDSDTTYVLTPSAQNRGQFQLTRYVQSGAFGDSQYTSISKAIDENGLIHMMRLPLEKAEQRLNALMEAEAQHQASMAATSQIDAKDTGNTDKNAAFNAWFGNSKVTDENGKPLVVYHGTFLHKGEGGIGDIAAFDRLFTTKFRKHSIDTVGSWFSTNPGDGGAEMYSGTNSGSVIYPVHLSIQNPQVTTFALMTSRARKLANGKDDGRQIGKAEVDAYRYWLKSTGKDGIKIEGRGNEGSTEFDNQVAWIALDPTQIKSAIGNNGEFNPDNPDIRFKLDASKTVATDYLLPPARRQQVFAVSTDESESNRLPDGWSIRKESRLYELLDANNVLQMIGYSRESLLKKINGANLFKEDPAYLDSNINGDLKWVAGAGDGYMPSLKNGTQSKLNSAGADAAVIEVDAPVSTKPMHSKGSPSWKKPCDAQLAMYENIMAIQLAEDDAPKRQQSALEKNPKPFATDFDSPSLGSIFERIPFITKGNLHNKSVADNASLSGQRKSTKPK